MVRSVSEDKIYDTIEFNEFLQMMGQHQVDEITPDQLLEAFKYEIHKYVSIYSILIT